MYDDGLPVCVFACGLHRSDGRRARRAWSAKNLHSKLSRSFIRRRWNGEGRGHNDGGGEGQKVHHFFFPFLPQLDLFLSEFLVGIKIAARAPPVPLLAAASRHSGPPQSVVRPQFVRRSC